MGGQYFTDVTNYFSFSVMQLKNVTLLEIIYLLKGGAYLCKQKYRATLEKQYYKTVEKTPCT